MHHEPLLTSALLPPFISASAHAPAWGRPNTTPLAAAPSPSSEVVCRYGDKVASQIPVHSAYTPARQWDCQTQLRILDADLE